MQRRVGQHDAQRVVAGSEGLREQGIRPARQDHDGPARALERGAFGFGDDAESFGRGQIADHQRERLVAAPLALAQQADRGSVATASQAR